MKSNPSPSAPLNLCAPVGVTGTTLPAAKVIARYDTSRGNVALEITRYTSHDGKVSYSYTGKHGAGSGHALEHVKNTVRIMLASHKGIRLSSGWDVLNEPSPSEPVKVLPDSCTMVLTEHTLTEWARLAADAYKAGHTMIGDKFSTARTCPAGSRLPIREFDALQAVYCGWLALGWARALEVWSERFPTSPIYSQPEPLSAFPVKDTPDFSGLAPIFDKAELASRKTAAAPALPVASVGVPSGVFHFMERSTKRCADPIDHDGELYGVIQCPEFALDVYAPVAMEMEAFKSTLRAFAGNAASHAAKDAKIKALEEACNLLIREMQFTGKIREDFSRRVAVEAGKKALALPSA